PSVTSDGTFCSPNVKLRNNDDVRTMFSIFSQYRSYVPIELDAKLVRSVQAIMSNMIRHRTYDEIAALMVRPGEDKVDAVNLSDP
ncbi:matrix metalloproteinase, partial [Trifolium medium]|nr:matrix metalloproteinase [Trifolium medium]